MPAPHASASFGSSKKKSDSTTRSVGGTRAAGMRGVETSASGGGRVKKAGRVLIFFTHFPLETPFLKAAVRPRSLRLSPRLTAEPRSLPHCWRWPPFTDPQPRECVHIIRYFGLHFFFSTGTVFFFFFKEKAAVPVCLRHIGEKSRFMQTSCSYTSLDGDGLHGVVWRLVTSTKIVHIICTYARMPPTPLKY